MWLGFAKIDIPNCGSSRVSLGSGPPRTLLHRINIWAYPHFSSSIGRPPPTPLNCKNEYPVLALLEETAVQAVVGFYHLGILEAQETRRPEMSARGYALHSVCPQLSFLFYLPESNSGRADTVLTFSSS